MIVALLWRAIVLLWRSILVSVAVKESVSVGSDWWVVVWGEKLKSKIHDSEMHLGRFIAPFVFLQPQRKDCVYRRASPMWNEQLTYACWGY